MLQTETHLSVEHSGTVRPQQFLLKCRRNGFNYLGFIQEMHLMFGRVYVNVHIVRVQFQA